MHYYLYEPSADFVTTWPWEMDVYCGGTLETLQYDMSQIENDEILSEMLLWADEDLMGSDGLQMSIEVLRNELVGDH